MNEIQVFKNERFGEIRTLEMDGQIYFVGVDVAKALQYSDPIGAVRKHVDHEDRTVLSKSFYKEFLSGQNSHLENFPNRGLIIINESGLYALIMSSKLPDAKKFKHWVTSEVLPEIRRTGGYRIRNLSDEKICDRLEALEHKIDMFEKKSNGKPARTTLEIKIENAVNRALDKKLEPVVKRALDKKFRSFNKSSNRKIRTVAKALNDSITYTVSETALSLVPYFDTLINIIRELLKF